MAQRVASIGGDVQIEAECSYQTFVQVYNEVPEIANCGNTRNPLPILN